MEIPEFEDHVRAALDEVPHELARALEQDPTLPAVRDALRHRTHPSHPIDPQDVVRLLELVRARLGQ